MSDAVYCFDVDDCLEIGGQFRIPSTAGPVTIASIRKEASPPDADLCFVVGNWINLPSVLPDWRDIFQMLLPPMPGNAKKGFWLAWIRAQYPGFKHYVMIGNRTGGHQYRPAYWDQQWPGTVPAFHVPGDNFLSDDYKAAQESGFEFLKEDQWAAGQRVGTIPPRDPAAPFYQFPKHVRPPMEYKYVQAPEILKVEESGDQGIVEAIVSVTGNVDRQKDIIEPGAWKRVVE